jgi:glycosyltransferase involved in cell wall biosynthesis
VSDLIVTSVTPNLNTGRGVRTYGVTAALAQHRRVEVAYAVFDWPTPAPEYGALPNVTFRALEVSRGSARAVEYVRARLRRVPSGFARGVSPELARAAEGQPEDVRVIADGPTVAAALLPLARRRPVVYLAHNLESSFRTGRGGGLERFERGLVRTFSESWMATRADERGAIELAGEHARTRYVPNVVDVAAIEPVRRTGGERAVFVADFTYPFNREALAFLADEILPRIWERRPKLRLAVAGRGAGDLVLDERIEILGFVADLRSAYGGADLAVVPLLRGGGSPLKFVEALAYGLPVVATDHAARLIEDGEPGTHFLTAGGPQEFAEAVERLLNEPELGAALAAAGRELVERCYSTQALARLLAASVTAPEASG